ncbi:TPM domain-containing protein [Candidatus Woesearchaeota archaeon]|nr:TPM domain-containing protein [Candidatus Woesearchaeota archaeon]
MKRWIFFVIAIILLSSAYADTIKINGFVNDYANIIPPVDEEKLEQVLKAIYDSEVAEYSIVTVKSLDGKDIESYSIGLAQGNLGDKEKNNGLLLLVAVDDRLYRFEVGRGLEATLNDAKVGRIGRQYMVENFRNNEYGKGILEASLAVESVLLGKTESEFYVKDEPKQSPLGTIISLIMFFWLFSIIMRLLHSKKKKDRYFGAAMTALWLFGPRGGKGGFGGTGGFGGFGGGGFGGGGASGGW